ncbi:MAG: family 20 glycosylhydrolase [Clostridia bacterium]|nr:family 20 glycosylhydrolase [Clostridia bacterium]
MNIIPRPQEIKLKETAFSFGAHLDCTLFCDHIDETLLSRLFRGFTHATSRLAVAHGKETTLNAITFGDYHEQVIELSGEVEYAIHITEQGACIRGDNRVSLLHGYYTFLQMIETDSLEEGREQFSVPCGDVKDWSDVDFRGIDLCIFSETPLSFLQKAIRLCAFYKFTHVALNFWGTLRYDAMEELSWEHAYTKEEIRPVIEEARAMGLEIIPMLNHLGHAAQARDRYGKHVVLDQNPKLALLFEEDGWTWCLSNPETHKLLRKMREELMELCGEGEYFSLGFDEAYSFASCPKCRKKNKQELFLHYINGLAEELKEKGRRGIIWGDMFLDKEKWQLPIWATGRKEHGIYTCLDKLSRDLIIADWQYEIKEGIAESTGFFVENGFDTLVSPWDTVENIDVMTNTCIEKKAKGILTTTWDTLPERLWLIGYVAGKAWNSSHYSTELDDIMVKSAEVLRKTRENGYTGYHNAGWKPNEV